MDVVETAELARRVVARGASGTAAEGELCRRFASRVRLLGLKHLRDEDRARDLVQSVLLAVVVALRDGRVEDLERIDRFVLATARNLALRAQRDGSRAEVTDPSELDVAVSSEEPAGLDAGALLRCLGALEPRARTVVQLAFYREKTAEEIAAVLETTAGNVRVMRHRAMAQLRTCLGAGGAA